MNFTEDQKLLARQRVLEELEKLMQADYGKLTVNVNKDARRIEIIPEPHYCITDRKVSAIDKHAA